MGEPEINPAKAKVQTTYKSPGTFYGMCLPPGARQVFAAGSDYAVHVFDFSSEKKEPIAKWPKHDNYVAALAFVRGPRFLDTVVSAGFDRQLIWWNIFTGHPIRTVAAHEGWVRDAVTFPDNERLVTVGDDMLGKIWDAKTGRLLRTLKGHASRTPESHVTALYVAAVSSDGEHVATADRIGEVCVWNSNTGELITKFRLPVLYTYDPRQRKRSIGGIRSLTFSPDGKQLAVGGMGQVGNVDGMAGEARVEVCDWQAGKSLVSLKAEGHKGIINHLCYHPTGKWLIGAGGGSDNALIAFWDPTKPKPVHKIKGDGHVHRLAVHPTGRQLYTAGYGKLEIWDLTG